MSKERIEKRITRELKVVKKHLEITGVSTDMDDSEWQSKEAAIINYNNNSGDPKKRSIEDLTDRYAMVRWLTELGHPEPLNEAITYWNDPESIAGLEPTPGALIISAYLGKTLKRVTARPGWPEITKATKDGYKKTMPWVGNDKILIQEGLSINSEFKVENAAPYHFEDAQNECERMSLKGVISVLIPQPWNEGYETDDPNILTFKDALSNGLPRLRITPKDFRGLPKFVQAYFILADHILEKRLYEKNHNGRA